QEVLVEVQPQVAGLGADDAVRHRAGQAERGADGQHPVADLHRVGVAQAQVRGVVQARQADDGQVGLAVAADVLRQELPPVLQADLGDVGTVHNVQVGQDHAVR